jgi:polygalacturonase
VGTATAATIQEAIEKVGLGGTVTVLPGTYVESLRITKGVTLQSTGERSGAAILAPPDKPEVAIEIATSDPVIIRGFTIHVTGRWGVVARGAVDLTVERPAAESGRASGRPCPDLTKNLAF